MSYSSLRKGKSVAQSLAVTVPWMLAIVLAVGASSAWASIAYDIDKDWTLYGHLSQYDESVVPQEIRPWACVPVATANSFVYLQNKYPGVYDNLLVPGGDIGAVVTILAGVDYMNTIAGIGTWYDMGIYGKQKYLEEVAPGLTIYGAQLTSTWAFPGDRPGEQIPPIDKPSWVQDDMYPTWEFLHDNLVACEDVEIGINEDSWGHCLTLTSFHWIDANEDYIIQQTETAWIDYVDPATGGLAYSDIWQDAKGSPIFVDYGGSTATLTMAMRESPIPEPATIIVWSLLGVVAYGFWRRRRAA